jgi:hypothetical protein
MSTMPSSDTNNEVQANDHANANGYVHANDQVHANNTAAHPQAQAVSSNHKD